jgi:hypothetical protein
MKDYYISAISTNHFSLYESFINQSQRKMLKQLSINELIKISNGYLNGVSEKINKEIDERNKLKSLRYMLYLIFSFLVVVSSLIFTTIQIDQNKK